MIDIGKPNIAVQFKYLNDDVNDNENVGEFNIIFKKGKNSVDKLLEFVDMYDAKRINIKFPDGMDMPTLKSAHRVSDKVGAILTPEMIAGNRIPNELAENGIGFFFDSNLPAYNYCMLSSLLDAGVSDVYIADDLCYNMEDVHEICADRGVGIRAILNKIPMTTPNKGDDEKSVIFLPRDIEYLKDYVDTFEFDCGDPCDWAKFDVLYRTFFERSRWGGEMAEINDDIYMSYDDDTILPYLAASRYSCGRRCDMRKSNNCRKCHQYLETQRHMHDMGARIVTK